MVPLFLSERLNVIKFNRDKDLGKKVEGPKN